MKKRKYSRYAANIAVTFFPKMQKYKFQVHTCHTHRVQHPLYPTSAGSSDQKRKNPLQPPQNSPQLKIRLSLREKKVLHGIKSAKITIQREGTKYINLYHPFITMYHHLPPTYHHLPPTYHYLPPLTTYFCRFCALYRSFTP